MAEKIVMTKSNEATSALFGAFDLNAKMIESAFDVRISNRNRETEDGDAIVISGDADAAESAARAMEYLKHMAGEGETLSEQSVEYVIGLVKDNPGEAVESFGNVICITNRGKPIKAKTVGQKKYVRAIKENTIVLGLGPAGTGKTFLAVAMATEALRNKEVSRIILTRPAVEAGERLGFLPGDLQSKIDPYLRPLYDALFEMLGPENYQRHACLLRQEVRRYRHELHPHRHPCRGPVRPLHPHGPRALRRDPRRDGARLLHQLLPCAGVLPLQRLPQAVH